MTEACELPVLIVGAGPVGMMAAITLARQGVEARIIDSRTEPTRAPAAHVVNARTFEICRAAGVDMDALGEYASDPRDAGRAIWLTSLAGEEVGRLPFERQDEEVLRFTPTPLRNLPQHRFEAVLRETIAASSADGVEYGRRWEAAEQDDRGVTSRVRDLASGRVHEIRSRYLIACDGAGSRVRKSIGIEMSGPPKLMSFVMIHFTANLRELLEGREGVLYWLLDPELGATFVAHDIDHEWVYMTPFDSEVESQDDYSAARCQALVAAGIGSDAYPVKIETVSTWTMSAQIAERFRRGRILLAGDSAHRFPPTGGLGLNSGVQDIHGLAWRIAAIEAGWARPSILDSYEVERRPVAQRNADNSLRNASKLMEVRAALGTDRDPSTARMRRTLDDPQGRACVAEAIANQAEHFDTLGLQLGYVYEEGAIVPDGSPPPPIGNPVRELLQTGRPGARMPHTWLERDGARRSSLDLLAFDGFTLVTTEASVAWAAAAARTAKIPIRYVALDRSTLEDAEAWEAASGIAADGALLVRPDQHVAWRAPSLPADAGAALAAALARILGETTP